MKEKSKYYTPTIEEFRVGFEYEQYFINNSTWNKKEVTIDDTLFILNENLVDGEIRVKLLDREDIEEVGFNNFTDSRGWWRGFMKINEEEYIVIHLGRNIVLEKKRKVDNNPYAHPNILFAGKIKNKSELQQILKMVL